VLHSFRDQAGFPRAAYEYRLAGGTDYQNLVKSRTTAIFAFQERVDQMILRYPVVSRTDNLVMIDLHAGTQ